MGQQFRDSKRERTANHTLQKPHGDLNISQHQPEQDQARLQNVTDTSFGHLRCARFRSHEGCEDVESLIDPILQAAIYTPRELAAFCNTSM